MDLSPTLFHGEPLDSALTQKELRLLEIGQPPAETVPPVETEVTVPTPEHKVFSISAPVKAPNSPLFGDRIYFKVIRNWEGAVAELREDAFVAHVRDMRSASDQGDEEFEIALSLVPQDDLPLVRKGAIFFLTVGYWVTKGGQRSTDTRIIFRRMPRWSAKDISKARARADEYLSFFGVADSNAQTA